MNNEKEREQERGQKGRFQQISLCIVQEWDPDEIISLYQEGGWWDDSWDRSKIPAMIRGSHRFIVAVDEITGSAVGMGRTISDGVSDAYIQDVVVRKEYRRCYIGVQIIRLLTRICEEEGILWIGLISEPGTLHFYKKIGFQPMEQYIPMIYKKEDDNALSQ
ncbi:MULTISPECIES: GNAT family N-acetyltransferase [Methanocalculus]|uniref:GNAT family N-acetyltransferase n=1 Tax=Methanocalculus TaxID=71151 RepID=UPI0020A0A0AF|nr:GNAT family N-acetyltransferase [Methanocalculus sp. MSAO_Arc1]MCP1661994.1 ribosomal protein S18 acetylase RimI-like enzyme [Methanocalculus sp. AMF5]